MSEKDFGYIKDPKDGIVEDSKVFKEGKGIITFRDPKEI